MPINYRTYAQNFRAISKWIVTKRAQKRCELCGALNGSVHWKTGSNVVLTVHHIDGDKTNDSLKNLIALCQRCHLRLDAPYRERKRRAPQKNLFSRR